MVTLSKDCQRTIGQPELEAAILARQVSGDLQLALAQALYPISPIGKVVEKGQFHPPHKTGRPLEPEPRFVLPARPDRLPPGGIEPPFRP